MTHLSCRLSHIDGDLADAPYELEVCDGADQPGRMLAVCSTAGIAFGAYYAALREHFGRRVVLRRAGRVVVAGGLEPA